jgi:hypothetical protein
LSKDITSVLAGWEHDPEDLQVRIVAGDDGRDKLQMRIPLGLIQMEIAGRPDGERFEEYDSLLDACESRAQLAEQTSEEFELDSQTCAELMREGLQYYHRYLASFHLQRFDLVARDTARNLRLFAFVVQHAARQNDKIQFDRYRPYVTMMWSRALAHQSLLKHDHRGALAAIDEGIEKVRQFLRDYEQSENEAACEELGFLLRWRKEIERERPVGPVERLEHQLSLAVALEDYEEAARLRDQLERLKGTGIGSRP